MGEIINNLIMFSGKFNFAMTSPKITFLPRSRLNRETIPEATIEQVSDLILHDVRSLYIYIWEEGTRIKEEITFRPKLQREVCARVQTRR